MLLKTDKMNNLLVSRGGAMIFGVGIQLITSSDRMKTCKVCGKEFILEIALKKHKTRKHATLDQNSASEIVKNQKQDDRIKEKNFTCDICDKSFTRKDSLHGHIQAVHNKEKRFQCSICNHEFYLKHNMESHVKRVHNKEKNFQCDICDKAFTQKVM